MKRVWPIIATIAALTAACLVATPALAKTPIPPARQVTLVLAPYLTWDDISPTSTPSIWRLAETGALASVNARSRVRQPGQGATPLEGALAISAGAWALPDWSAPAAYDATETLGAGSAHDAYQRIYGADMDGARIAYLGLPMVRRTNTAASIDASLGTLGQAVRDANGLTAAIGNSDTGFAEKDELLQRPAAVAAMDGSGLVLYGDVSADLLGPVASAPFGKATDLVRFRATLDRVNALARAHAGPALVVLDAGDLARADDFSEQVAPAVAAGQRAAALAALDSVVGMASAAQGTDGVVIVASQALIEDAAGPPQGLSPLVIAGRGFSGYATSSSTHRVGIVTNLDITATVLDVLGIRRPVGVLGNPMVPIEGPASPAERAARLSAANRTFIAIDVLRPAVGAALLWLVVGVLALTVLITALAPRLSATATRGWVRALRLGLLLSLALPLAAWLMFVFATRPPDALAVTALFAGTALALTVAAYVLTGKVGVRMPVAALSLLTAAVLIAEQFVNAPLSVMSLLSYSPLLGARYYGMGNEAAAMAFGACVVGTALLLDEWPTSRANRHVRSWGVAVIGAVFVVAAAAPFLGANVGVAVWGTAGFGLAWLLLGGRRLTWRAAAGIALVVVLAIAAFSAIDLLGGGEQTHLGRALAGAKQGGIGTLWTIVARKANANARVLANTRFSWILVAAVGVALFARWRPRSDWPRLMAENPSLARAVSAATAAGVIGFFSEDSGIVIPSLIALYVGVAIAWLMLERLGEDAGVGDGR